MLLVSPVRGEEDAVLLLGSLDQLPLLLPGLLLGLRPALPCGAGRGGERGRRVSERALSRKGNIKHEEF